MPDRQLPELEWKVKLDSSTQGNVSFFDGERWRVTQIDHNSVKEYGYVNITPVKGWSGSLSISTFALRECATFNKTTFGKMNSRED